MDLRSTFTLPFFKTPLVAPPFVRLGGDEEAEEAIMEMVKKWIHEDMISRRIPIYR